jgi:hypothetical protein
MDLSMPLSYRIASMPPRIIPPAWLPAGHGDIVTRRVMEEVAEVASCPKFLIDPVADYFKSFGKRWGLAEDIPNWAPPFRSFFSEFSYPLDDGSTEQVGMLVSAVDVTDANRADASFWYFAFSELMMSRCHAEVIEQTAGWLTSSRWVMLCSLWSAHRVTKGVACWLGQFPILFVAGDGRLVQATTPHRLSEDDGRGEAVAQAIAIVGLGISFGHCKNVRTEEVEVRRPGNWHVNTGVPVYKYRTLHIDPMKETLRREGRSDDVGLARALHICRGHFATYSEESPLFGRYSGTFWKPQHVRGKATAGVVVKDYAVSPGGS